MSTRVVKKGLEWLFLGALLTLPVACWQHDRFVALDIHPDVSREPAQSPVSEAPFQIVQAGVTYRIEPQFRYQLSGLVVSKRSHDGDSMLHGYWNDHLNVADLCVVWGSNATALDLNAYDFWNGQFTCFVKTRDSAAWARFRMPQMSNNHLISADEYLRDAINDVEIGDQISLHGLLASYSNGAGYERGTSTVRTDTGNGACETIYVESFVVERPMRSPWRWLENVAWWSLLLSAAGWILGVGRGAF